MDGRSVKEVRPIWSEVAYLPRAHGSALFTRGETQALVVATLGTKDDEQKIESFEGNAFRRFMLHYNFPSFSTGEVKRFGNPGRREIGHGALAQRAIEAVMPTKEEFPYTIRVVSEILESNGSSSMASVCGASMALMDAGAPLKAPVAGIAMGLVKEGDKVGILTDIMGSEDHYGDMDFKVAGTEKGITALQMDIKIGGVSIDIMRQALAQAKEARLHVLGKMAEVIKGPRTELSPHAPRFITIKIRPEKIREIIGPGGKVIRGMQEKTGARIDVEDDGKVTVFSPSSEAAQMAIGMIQDICREAELDRIYVGKVKSIKEFGAFVEIIPGNEGLLHISQIAENRIRDGGRRALRGRHRGGQGHRDRQQRQDAALPQGGAEGSAGGRRAGEAQDRPERESRLVAYRKSALPNGIRLVTETMPHVRSVAVGIWVETGSRLEPEPLGGISHLIEHLVFKGTATRSAEEIARAIDSVGGQMDAFTAKEHTCFYVQVLDEHLPLAVSLLTDILRQPLFAPADIEKEKAVVLQEIKMVEDTPDDLIHDLFAEQVWAGHPLGRPILGRWDVVKEFDRDTVLGYFEREYVPGRIVVAVAGHAEHERVADLFAAGFEGWGRPTAPHSFVPPTLRSGVHTVQKPLEQVHLVIGLPGVSDTAPDRYPLYLLNDIIGGSMSSRLFQEIRERQALVYSVHSGQQAYRDTGALLRLRGHGPGQLRQGPARADEGDSQPQEGRGHRRRARPVQGASQGEPDALARVHVVSNEPIGVSRDALRLVHVHGRDAGRDRPRADGRGGHAHPPRARRGAALAPDPGGGGPSPPPPRPDALLRRRR